MRFLILGRRNTYIGKMNVDKIVGNMEDLENE